MEPTPSPLPADVEATLRSSGGPLEVGPYVVMRRDVYDAMLGVAGDDRAETLAAVRRGLADVDAGKTHNADEVLARLQARYEA